MSRCTTESRQWHR